MLNPNTKILIVDDSKVARLILRRLLNELGYSNIIEAANGPSGISMYTHDNPELIFLDIVMPEMTGDEVLANIRAVDETIPVVILSSATSDVQVKICEEIGITEFVQKPLTEETGLNQLREALSKVNIQ